MFVPSLDMLPGKLENVTPFDVAEKAELRRSERCGTRLHVSPKEYEVKSVDLRVRFVAIVSKCSNTGSVSSVLGVVVISIVALA